MNGLSGMRMEQQETPIMEQGETGAMEQQKQGGITVEDVAQALMSGVSPEELMKKGVPVELIKAAIQMLQQQGQAQAGQEQPQGQGLSAAGMQ